MIFGKIDYLNLLPFHLFLKRFASTTRHQMSVNYKKGVPSKINEDFLKRRVDAAFISSIKARRCRQTRLGIIAKKEVKSVLLKPSALDIKDSESATSNVLARTLGLHGEVLIGDKALKAYLEGVEAIDLAQVWHEKYQLPFVFATLCYHNHHKHMKSLTREFLKTQYKIPQYLLERASQKTGIEKKEILSYLKLISYEIDGKSRRGLKQFHKLSSALGYRK